MQKAVQLVQTGIPFLDNIMADGALADMFADFQSIGRKPILELTGNKGQGKGENFIKDVIEKEESEAPECDKMLAVQPQSQMIGEFLEAQENKNRTLCEYSEEIEQYTPTRLGKEKLLAEYFGIDLNKVEKEKRQILKNLNK